MSWNKTKNFSFGWIANQIFPASRTSIVKNTIAGYIRDIFTLRTHLISIITGNFERFQINLATNNSWKQSNIWFDCNWGKYPCQEFEHVWVTVRRVIVCTNNTVQYMQYRINELVKYHKMSMNNLNFVTKIT